MRTGETIAGGDVIQGYPAPYGGYGMGYGYGCHRPGYAPAIALGTIGTVAGGLALLGEWWGKGRRGRDGFDGECGRGYGYNYPAPMPYMPMPGYAGYPAYNGGVVIEQNCGHNRNHGCGCDDGDRRKIDKYELNLVREQSMLEAKIAKLEAEKYAESKICCVQNETTKALTEIRDLKQELNFRFAETDKIAALKDVIVKKDAELLACNLDGKIIAVNKRVDLEAERRECCCSKADMRLALEGERRAAGDAGLGYEISLEAERRKCADDKILEFVECRYIPGRKYMPSDRVGRLVPCGDRAEFSAFNDGYQAGRSNVYAGNGVGQGSTGTAFGKTIYKDNTFTNTPTTTITNSGDGDVAGVNGGAV